MKEISEASQIAALLTAIAVARGHVKLSPAQRELFEAQIEAIRQRIIAASVRRETAQEGVRR